MCAARMASALPPKPMPAISASGQARVPVRSTSTATPSSSTATSSTMSTLRECTDSFSSPALDATSTRPTRQLATATRLRLGNRTPTR